MSSFPMRRLMLTARARYHLWSGRRAYRLGRIRAAGRHVREAIASGHESFEAYLLLAKIHYRENDLTRAATFFARARSSDPARFLLEGFPEDFIESLRERPVRPPTASGDNRPQYRIVIETTRRGRTPEHEPAHASGAWGDFTSRDEWLRHRDRPPLQPGEGHDVDWDNAAQNIWGPDQAE